MSEWVSELVGDMWWVVREGLRKEEREEKRGQGQEGRTGLDSGRGKAWKGGAVYLFGE